MSKEKEKIETSVKQNSRKLFGFIRNRVKSEDDAEDILQEVWYQLSKIVNIDDIENVSSWLYQVARNKIIDWYRKPREELFGDSLFNEEEGSDLKEILFEEAETPTEQMFKDIFWDTLMEALDELPGPQRKAFIENELEGKKLKDIAAENGESIKTIISRKQYAVKHLRKRLKNLYDEL